MPFRIAKSGRAQTQQAQRTGPYNIIALIQYVHFLGAGGGGDQKSFSRKIPRNLACAKPNPQPAFQLAVPLASLAWLVASMAWLASFGDLRFYLLMFQIFRDHCDGFYFRSLCLHSGPHN